jgi:AcrR family transcriptional regulator
LVLAIDLLDRLLAAVGLGGYFDMVGEPDDLPGGALTVASGLRRSTFAPMTELSSAAVVPNASEARERLLTAAYDLFSHHGVQAVGVDTIIERSGVARQTMYRHFHSKQDLVLAFLERREEIWTYGWLAAEVQQRSSDPRERLLAIFDVFDEWFRTAEFEGCSFINVMLEHPDERHPLHRAAAAYLARIRDFLEGLARQAGIPEPEPFARQWHILMKGSIIAAGEGDRDAAMRAQEVATLLLDQALGDDGQPQSPAAPRPAPDQIGRTRNSAVSESSRASALVSPVRTKPSRS